MGYIGKKLDTKLYDTYTQEDIDNITTDLQNVDSTKVDKVTSTDNAIVRFDGTTGAVQNSGVVIDDNGNVGIGTASPTAKLEVEATDNLTTNTNVIRAINAANTGYTEFGAYGFNTSAVDFVVKAGGYEGIRVDKDNGNVGIGTSSPLATLDVLNKCLVTFDSNNAQFIGYNTDTIFGSTGVYSTKFYTNNYERMRILSSGGITFNGDTSTANALDDYEEGTWTPTYNFDIGGSGISYSEQVGRYIKIGDMVTIWFSIVCTGVTSSDYYARISLPISGYNAFNQENRIPIYNSGMSEFCASLSVSSSMLLYATRAVSDFARGDDVNGNRVSGTLSYRVS